jgi:hypothetical protein
MPMSGAERQRRYRERHNDLARITLDVRPAVRDRLDRLAWHFRSSVTQLVERPLPSAVLRRSCRGKALRSISRRGVI